MENEARVHSGILTNVSVVIAKKGYQVAALKYDDKLIIDTSNYRWENMIFLDSPSDIRLNIKKSDDSVITEDEAINNVIVYSVEKKINGKILSILGDSISTFGVPDQNNTEGKWTYPGNRCRYPQSNLFTDVDFTYWKRLIDARSMRLGINESWAGSRVSWDGVTESGDYGANKHIASLTRIKHLGENGNPDIIAIYAATNDAGGKVELGVFNTEDPSKYSEEEIELLPVNTFADAYRTMLIRAMYYYPTSRIIVIMPNFTTAYYSTPDLDKYIEVIREACDFFGIQYLDCRTVGVTPFNSSTYMPDGIHPGKNLMNMIFKELNKLV